MKSNKYNDFFFFFFSYFFFKCLNTFLSFFYLLHPKLCTFGLVFFCSENKQKQKGISGGKERRNRIE